MASSAKLGVVNSNKSAPFESLSGPGNAQIGAKKQVASEVVLQLQKVGIELSGSTILDVGFGFGFNAEAISSMGAKVFGVEPNTEVYNWAVREKKINEVNAFCGTLQDMPVGLADQVDVATVLLWNIYRSQYNMVLEALSRKISPRGRVVIGLHDQVYISDPYGVAVKPHAERYFGTVRATFFSGMVNQCLLICTNPRR